jgi:SAM-dependent methyltransferase
MKGTCFVCGWRGAFAQLEHVREGIVCGNCGANSRQRAVVFAVGLVLGSADLPLHRWPVRRDVRILESSARGSYPMLFRERFDYCGTEYDPDRIAAGDRPREFADFQRLHFADGAFDLVVASDVFEHVRDDRAGYAEVRRVLRDGGALVLTVPYDHSAAGTVVRVDTSGSEDVMLLPPEYHGGGGHTLTYRNYGRDLPDLLRSIGFTAAHLAMDLPELGIGPQAVFVARKGGHVELRPGWPADVRVAGIGPLLPFRAVRWLRANLAGIAHFARRLRR